MPTKEESTHVSPDKIIEDIGGCGRFQVRMAVVVHLIKTIVCFTFTGMIFLSNTPTWWCEDKMIENNMTSCVDTRNSTSVDYCPKKTCAINGTTCSRVAFDGSLTTAASEFNLVCAQDYIPSMINSIQISGAVVGNMAAGQVADLIGRRPPIFASIFFIIAFNIVGFFAQSWQIFAFARFFLGLGAAFFLTAQYCLQSEFSLARWRVWIVGFPSWPIQASIYSLLAWLIHDWRYLQLMTAMCGIPCLLAWFILPESFRWYIAHDKPEKAAKIIARIAKYNKHEEFNIDKALEKPKDQTDQKYTVLHLFKSRYLVKITLLLSVTWFAMGAVSYGITFGIQSLSGSIYLNIFLFSIVGIPSKAVALWLQNRFGRRATSIICFIIVAVGGGIVGFVQTFDAPNKNELTNGFALVANLGVNMIWGPVQTMTIELYPTVIRNIGFGSLSVCGRIGAILGPQLVYLNIHTPGLLYHFCAGISIVCLVALLFLPETMNQNLNDKIKEGTNNKRDVGAEQVEIKSSKVLDNGNGYTTQSKQNVFTMTSKDSENMNSIEKVILSTHL